MCEVRGIGIDLCEISRMQDLLDSGRSLRRMFTPEEEVYIRQKGATAAQTMAGIFAVKEAVLKALSTGLAVPLTDIIITHDEAGRPLATLQGKAAREGSMMVSITHDGGMAAGMAVWTA